MPLFLLTRRKFTQECNLPLINRAKADNGTPVDINTESYCGSFGTVAREITETSTKSTRFRIEHIAAVLYLLVLRRRSPGAG